MFARFRFISSKLEPGGGSDVVIGSEVAIPMSRAKCEEVDWPEVPDGACLAIIS